MEQVLIVDDDEGFLLSLKDMLAGGQQNFSILTAHNGIEAVMLLNRTPINLVVTDLKMPEMDGFDLLANISASHPDTPVIVMTAYGTPEMENRLKDMGAFQYIEKPIDFNVLLHKISDGLSSRAKGHIDGISLSSFMQLLQLDKKTCTLTVHYLGRSGVLYFQQGELTNAALGNLRGQEAAIEMASWEQAKIEIINVCKNTDRIITVPLGYILIEGARQKDEMDGARPGEDEIDTEEEQSRTSEIENILNEAHLNDLDFDTSVPVGEINEDEIVDEITHPSQEGNSLESLLLTLDSLKNVNRMIVIAKGGKVLAKKNAEVKKFGNFVAYAAAAAEQLGNGLGFSSVHQMIMSQANGDKLLVLSSPQIIVGIEVQGSVVTAPIVKSLRPKIIRTII